MTLRRLPLIAGVFVLLASLLALLLWWAMGPLLRDVYQSEALRVLPLEAFIFAISALALISCIGTGDRFARGMALFTALPALLVLGETVMGFGGGIEELLIPEGTALFASSPLGWRPPPQVTFSVLLYAMGLWFAAHPRESKVDAGDVLMAAASFLPFTGLLTQLFQVGPAVVATGTNVVSMSLLSALLLTVLAVGGIFLKPDGGLLQGYVAPTVGGEASRRLAPAAIFVPMFLGVLQAYAVQWELLELPAALALTATASIIVFLVLIHSVSSLLSRLQAEQMGAHRQQVSQVKEQGMTDALTGLYNRRGWEFHLKINEERCRQEELNACVIVVDMDGLKWVNDNKGHSEGDLMIRKCGKALKGAAAHGDILARLGGDEFAYLAMGCQPEHAPVVVRRLSLALEKAGVAASLGHAMRDLNENLKGAFDEADRSMYAHKRARKEQRARS